MSLCHTGDDTDIGNLDDANHSPTGSLPAAGEWEGWWQGENYGWREPEPVGEPLADIQGLA